MINSQNWFSAHGAAFAAFGAIPADSMTKLTLEVLGGFRLQTDAGEPVPLTTRKAQALLAYLALHPGQAPDQNLRSCCGATAAKHRRATACGRR